MTRKPKAVYVLETWAFERIYPADVRARIAALADVYAPPLTGRQVLADPGVLAPAEVIFSGWGAPVLDEALLDAAPNLRAVFYGAGATGQMLTASVWERGIAVTSAMTANAIPVAQYTLGAILFSLKHGWKLARQTRQERRFAGGGNDAPGCYGSTVGLVSLGAIARVLLKLLAPMEDLKVLVYDPFVTGEAARALGVEKVGLEELFLRSDVVSLHTPHLPETEGMITGALLGSMKPGATFINTARGKVVREREMIDVLSRRPDLQAVLDVTEKEPPEPDSPLYALENVVLTPHVAGSMGRECGRMGRYMVEELERYLAGEALKWEVTPQAAAHSSHRPVRQVTAAAAAAAATTTATAATTAPAASLLP